MSVMINFGLYSSSNSRKWWRYDLRIAIKCAPVANWCTRSICKGLLLVTMFRLELEFR